MEPKERFKFARKHLGLTQETLGNSLGLSQANVRDLESGKVKLSTLHALAMENSHGISADWLLFGTGEMDVSWKKVESVSLVASGNGNVQVGGRMSGNTIQMRDGSEPVWIQADHPHKDDIEEIFLLLKLYGSPKIISEFKEKLQKVKAAIEGE